MHMRTVIRQAAKAALLAAGTDAATRVQTSPYNARKTFPALSIEDAGAYLSGGVSESQEAITMPAGPDRRIKRLYRFAVVAELQPSPTDDDDRDTLVDQVEACIGALAVTGVKAIAPVGYQSFDDNTTGKPVRKGVQIFEALYYTTQADPTTPR